MKLFRIYIQRAPKDYDVIFGMILVKFSAAMIQKGIMAVRKGGGGKSMLVIDIVAGSATTWAEVEAFAQTLSNEVGHPCVVAEMPTTNLDSKTPQ